MKKKDESIDEVMAALKRSCATANRIFAALYEEISTSTLDDRDRWLVVLAIERHIQLFVEGFADADFAAASRKAVEIAMPGEIATKIAKAARAKGQKAL